MSRGADARRRILAGLAGVLWTLGVGLVFALLLTLFRLGFYGAPFFLLASPVLGLFMAADAGRRSADHVIASFLYALALTIVSYALFRWSLPA